MSQFLKSQGTGNQGFPEIIRANQSQVCICCLDRDLSFIRLASCKHADLMASYFKYAHPESVVCYRCHKMLENIEVFKQQVKESLRILNEQTPLIQSNKRLYRLKKSTVDITTISEEIDTSFKFVTFGSHRTFGDDSESTNSTITVKVEEDVDEFHDIDVAFPLSFMNEETELNKDTTHRTSGDDSESTDSIVTVEIEQYKENLVESHGTEVACSLSIIKKEKELDKFKNLVPIRQESCSSLAAQIKNVQNSHKTNYESLSRVSNSHNYYSSIQTRCVEIKSTCPETKCKSVPRISNLPDYESLSLSMLLGHIPVENVSQNVHQLSTQVTNTQNTCRSSPEFTLPMKNTSQPNNQFPPMKLNIDNVHQSTSEVISQKNNQSTSTQISKIQNNCQSSSNSKVLNIHLFNDDLPRLYLNNCKGKIKKVALTMEEVLKERESEKSKQLYLKMAYKCENCITGFDFKEKYQEHNMKKHAKSDGIVCGICKCVYENINKFRQHAEVHFIQYECVKCGERRRTLRKLIQHYNERHEVIDMQFRCTKCRFSTPSAHVFQTHKEMHENQPTCPHCGKTFKQMANLRTHITYQHRNREINKRFPCSQCSKTYSTPFTLRSHINNVHWPSDTGAYCTTCKMQFGSKIVLQGHLNTHSNHIKKRHTCDYCGARFVVKKSVEEHILKMHLKDARARHKCDQCDKIFTHAKGMQRHKEYVHEKKRPPRDKICHHCGKGFTYNKILKSHIRTHTGERPLQCPLCPATFAHDAALYNHKKLKHKVKPKKSVAETSGKKLSNTLKRKKTVTLTQAKIKKSVTSTEHETNSKTEIAVT